MFDMKQIGKKITNLRKLHNMTQMELADKLGISFQAVSNWERGNTMPDISKLPELAETFHVSVDELLNGKAPLVEAVLNDTVDEYMEDGNVTEQEIADVIPLLKPEQAGDILEKADVSKFQDISSFLPFMNSHALAEIAIEYVEQGDSVDELLPFLNEEDVARLAKKLEERGDSIAQCYPFMDEDDVAQIAYALLAKGDSASSCLPFMDEDDVTQLALRILRSKKR
jgi:transcriptional regulator with XRE-family HTH domain